MSTNSPDMGLCPCPIMWIFLPCENGLLSLALVGESGISGELLYHLPLIALILLTSRIDGKGTVESNPSIHPSGPPSATTPHLPLPYSAPFRISPPFLSQTPIYTVNPNPTYTLFQQVRKRRVKRHYWVLAGLELENGSV